MERSDLLKIAVIKKLTEIRRVIHESTENFNKDKKTKQNNKKKQKQIIEKQNIIMELLISISNLSLPLMFPLW